MFKILALGDIDINYIKKNLEKQVIFYTDYNLFNKSDIDFILIRGSNYKLDSIYLKDFKKLKYIFVLGIGMDNIDLQYCEYKNIKVINQPLASVYSVAELSVSMLIMGIRQGFCLGKKLLNGIYTRNPIGYNLEGKIIGVMGYGNIGKITTRLLSCFRNFVEFDINVYDILDNQYDDFLRENNIVFYKNMVEFFEKIDYLILHIPLTRENKNLINYNLVKTNNLKGIVNVSRKGIVNEKDIIKLLDENVLEFYITDVIEGEPYVENIDKKLLNHEKVFVTPHIGANTYQVQKRILDNVIGFLNKY